LIMFTILKPGTGSLVFTGNVPSTGGAVQITTAVGQLSLIPGSAFVTQQALRAPISAALSLVGTIPTVLVAQNITPSTGSLNFASDAPFIPTHIRPVAERLVLVKYPVQTVTVKVAVPRIVAVKAATPRVIKVPHD
jgi:hypothetical protein